MFYSQFILAKKGPLGTIWIAAHLERKLRKNQVADTDIGVSVDSILFPDVPIALRLSSHLLVGVVRIYSRKVSYLFDDCSEALLKIKQAFRSTAVDLPPEESTAPYHSITLPETFGLDDFELPDNDILQGNYVDHHVSTREQITLQDTMEGVAYSTSQFGLDERFGDGDASQVGLDLEEDLFLHKVEVPGHDGVSDVDPQASVKSMTQAKTDRSCNSPGSSDAVQVNGTINKVENLAANSEFIEIAQAPSTPGLVEESNLFNVQKGLGCDNHLELDDHNITENGTEKAENASNKSDINQREDVTYLSKESHLNHGLVVCMRTAENGRLDGNLEIGEAKGTEPINKTAIDIADSSKLEVSNSGSIYNTEPRTTAIHREDGDCGIFVEDSLCKTGDEVSNSRELSDPHDKSIALNAVCPLEQPDFHGLGDVEAKACQDLDDLETLKHNVDNEPSTSSCISVLRSCNSCMNPPEISSPSCGIHSSVHHGELRAEDVVPCSLQVSGNDEANLASESLKKMQGEECFVTDGVQPEGNQILDPVLSAKMADGEKQVEIPDNAFSNDNQAETLNSSMTSELPAPEKLLSAPQILVDKPHALLVEATPEEEILEGSDGSSVGTKTSGRKRSYTESSLTVQSLNSVESFGMTRSKRTINSVPDDDDLLSSILVGRKSSVFKMKPTPVLEVISAKRARSASRPSVSKRKVLMDDSMVLLGDTIRLQLTNTEDIRRLRKKAPCTRTEILVIQRQFLEEEIFTEPVLSGVSAELTCLCSKKIDLSGIKISKNDMNNASSQASKDIAYSTETIMQPNEVKGNGGTVICTNDVNGEDLYIGSFGIADNRIMDAIADVTGHRPSENETLEQVADMELQSANTETGASAKNSVIHGEISGDLCNMPPGFVDQSDLLEENISHALGTSMIPSDKMDTQVIETVSTDMSYWMGFDGLRTSDHCTDDIGAAENEFRGEEISLEESKVDASIEVRADVQVNCCAPNDDAENFTSSAHDEADNSANVHADQVFGDIGNEKLVSCNDNDDVAVNLVYEDKDQRSDLLDNECSKIDSRHLVELDGDLNRASLNDGNYSVCEETDQQRTMNEEIDHVAVGQSGDLQDDEFAHDTEFLNVDDDEVSEDNEDDMAGKEDVQILENSGWSSRTRAVAKYLQTIFDKEEGHGRKVISMDNLLANKTRKEASRMFFETLVLKTRDYIQVEQEIPFDNISLKPRAKLIKSIF